MDTTPLRTRFGDRHRANERTFGAVAAAIATFLETLPPGRRHEVTAHETAAGAAHGE